MISRVGEEGQCPRITLNHIELAQKNCLHFKHEMKRRRESFRVNLIVFSCEYVESLLRKHTNLQVDVCFHNFC